MSLKRATRASSKTILKTLRLRKIFTSENNNLKKQKRQKVLFGEIKPFNIPAAICKNNIRNGPLKLIESLVSQKTQIEDILTESKQNYSPVNPVSLIRKGVCIPACQLKEIIRNLKKNGVLIGDKKNTSKEFSQIILVKKKIRNVDLSFERRIMTSKNPLIKFAVRKSCR